MPPHFGHDDATQLPELLPPLLLPPLELAPPEQAPSVHDCPAEHATHAAPPVPQLAVAPLAWHVPVVSQHPVWHVVGAQPASSDPAESPAPALASSPELSPEGASPPPDDEPPLLPDPSLEASDVPPDAVPTG